MALANSFYSLRTYTRVVAAIILVYKGKGYKLSNLELEAREGARGGDTNKGDIKGGVS